MKATFQKASNFLSAANFRVLLQYTRETMDREMDVTSRKCNYFVCRDVRVNTYSEDEREREREKEAYAAFLRTNPTLNFST